MQLTYNHVDNGNVEILFNGKFVTAAYREVDGTFHVSFQESIGGWPSWILYEIAFILDELNKPVELATAQVASEGFLTGAYRKGELHIDSNQLSYTSLREVYKATPQNPAGNGEALQVNDVEKEHDIRMLCRSIADSFHALQELTEPSDGKS